MDDQTIVKTATDSVTENTPVSLEANSSEVVDVAAQAALTTEQNTEVADIAASDAPVVSDILVAAEELNADVAGIAVEDVPVDNDADAASDELNTESTEAESITAEDSPAVNTIENNTVSEHPVQDILANEDLAIAASHTDSGASLESDRMQEVPALLGGVAMSVNEEPELILEQAAVTEEVVPVDNRDSEDNSEKVTAATNFSQELIELKSILEAFKDSLQDSINNTNYISSKIDTVAGDTECLIKQVDNLSGKYDQLAVKNESDTSNAKTDNLLSKTFLTISSVVIATLVGFQIYSFTYLVKNQRLQDALRTSVLENISRLDKKMADYDKNLTKVSENQPPQQHSQPHPAAVEVSGHDGHGSKDNGVVSVTPVLEKLNKLRNGLPEKKLIRKETGDWFVYNKKSEESIADVDVIESLNQAYRRIGRPTTPGFPMPAYKALCLLKPDGKGGTQVVMTKDFMP